MKAIVIFFSGLVLFLSGCAEQKDYESEKQEPQIVQPYERYIPENDMQDYINEEVNLAIDLGNQFIVMDAANALANVRDAMVAMRQKNYGNAREHLTQA